VLRVGGSTLGKYACCSILQQLLQVCFDALHADKTELLQVWRHWLEAGSAEIGLQPGPVQRAGERGGWGGEVVVVGRGGGWGE
jgi:hypothetical protein